MQGILFINTELFFLLILPFIYQRADYRFPIFIKTGYHVSRSYIYLFLQIGLSFEGVRESEHSRIFDLGLTMDR